MRQILRIMVKDVVSYPIRVLRGKWMKDNINYNPEDDLWWWAIYTVEADKELEWNDLEFYNPQGNKLEDQPVR